MMETSDILYTGTILTKESQTKLHTFISKKTAVPCDWKWFCHHMTIHFKPKDDAQLPVFGKEVNLIVTHLVSDNKGMVVRVKADEINMPPEQAPHISIAMSPGTPPVYSNELLKTTTGDEMSLEVTGVLGAKLKTGKFLPESEDLALENFNPEKDCLH